MQKPRDGISLKLQSHQERHRGWCLTASCCSPPPFPAPTVHFNSHLCNLPWSTFLLSDPGISWSRVPRRQKTRIWDEGDTHTLEIHCVPIPIINTQKFCFSSQQVVENRDFRMCSHNLVGCSYSYEGRRGLQEQGSPDQEWESKQEKVVKLEKMPHLSGLLRTVAMVTTRL